MFHACRHGFAHALPALLVTTAIGAHAAQFQLTYKGTFDTSEALNLASDATPTYFSATTAFTIHSYFDDASANLAPPLPGFVAYSPTRTTIAIGGATYTVESAATNPLAGVAVTIFDKTNLFNPGRYGAGLIADVARDGAGLVGDFLSASPDFATGSLTPTTFTEYQGVGHGSGVCKSGTPPACDHEVTPWVLHDGSGAAWNLTFGNYIENYPGSALNTAVITAVPEPATAALMMLGAAGLGWAARRRAS